MVLILFLEFVRSWRPHIHRGHSQTEEVLTTYREKPFLVVLIHAWVGVVYSYTFTYIQFWPLLLNVFFFHFILFLDLSDCSRPEPPACVWLLLGDSTPWPLLPLWGWSFTSQPSEYVIQIVENISFTSPNGSTNFQRRRLAQAWPPVQPAAPAICSPLPHSKKQIIIDFFSYCRWGEFNNSSQISSSLHSGAWKVARMLLC